MIVKFVIIKDKFQNSTQIFYTDSSFLDEFKKLDAVLKEFEIKDHSNRLIINVKMINLNRQTLPLYKRLDDKNKTNQDEK